MITTFSTLSQKVKRQLIDETAALMGVDQVVVEKDIWVSMVLGKNIIPIRVTTAERTFREKATIAHQIVHNGKIPPPRYSRHYYEKMTMPKWEDIVRELQNLENRINENTKRSPHV